MFINSVLSETFTGAKGMAELIPGLFGQIRLYTVSGFVALLSLTEIP